jgi:hypothetical protein
MLPITEGVKMKLLKRLLFVVAKEIGWSTVYHVAWDAPTDQGHSRGDIGIEVNPWIGMGNRAEIRAYVASNADAALGKCGAKRTGDLVLMSVTRLS